MRTVTSVSEEKADYVGPCDSCPRLASTECEDRAETANRGNMRPLSEDECIIENGHSRTIIITGFGMSFFYR